MMWTKIKNTAVNVCVFSCIIGTGFLGSSATGLAADSNSAPSVGGSETILDTKSVWRCFAVRGSELCRTESGELRHLYEFDAARMKKVRDKETGKHKRVGILNTVEPGFTAFPPPEWIQPDFDDSRWALVQGQIYAKYAYIPTTLVCLRGRFHVTDPSNAGDLNLSLSFQGGAAVYLNGREVTRAHLPGGELKPDTPAEDYPREAFLGPNGKLFFRRYAKQFNFPDINKHPKSKALRTRKLSSVKIPGNLLQKGVNVLALEIHRAPAAEQLLTTFKASHYAHWQRTGLVDVKLTSSGNSTVRAIASPQKVQVFNVPVDRRIHEKMLIDPSSELRPMRIVGARNGFFSDKVLVTAPGPLHGLRATVTDLKGPGTISTDALQIRYGVFDRGSRRRGHWVDGLETDLSAATREDVKKPSLCPVWLTVQVPEDAAPGEYKGSLAIEVKGAEEIRVPVVLEVVDWVVPDPREFITHAGLVQSPETLALKYNVPLWSEAHWKLIDRTFSIMGQIGAKEVYITAIRRTHFGNEHAMIRFTDENGTLKPDFSIAEKYLDTAIRHLGNIPVVGIYCWEHKGKSAYPSGLTREQQAEYEHEVRITLLDPETGMLSEGKSLKWGTPECQDLWNATFRGIRTILKKRGMEASLMFAMAGDYTPSPVSGEQLHKAAPEAKWIVHSHVHRLSIQNVPVGLLACVWGVYGTQDPIPSGTRYYGWKNQVTTAYPRVGCPVLQITSGSSPMDFRYLGEGALVSNGRRGRGVKGFSRMSADFWKVLKNKPLCGRYPETGWGSLDMGRHHMLSPGKDGAIATARFEMLREGLQECEARIFIEKALLDEQKRAGLGKDAERIQAILDERVRTFMRGIGVRNKVVRDTTWYQSRDWQVASKQLYQAAAKVATAIGRQ